MLLHFCRDTSTATSSTYFYHFSLIFYSSSLLICTLLLHFLWPFSLPFISLLLSTLMSFVLDPSLFLLFWLFLSPTSYYKFDSLTCTLYIFSPHKKVYYSLSHFFFSLFFGGFFFSFFCISTLGWWIFVFFRIIHWIDAIWFVFLCCYLFSFSFFFLLLLNIILLHYKDCIGI